MNQLDDQRLEFHEQLPDLGVHHRLLAAAELSGVRHTVSRPVR
jgi:hypothetical protein